MDIHNQDPTTIDRGPHVGPERALLIGMEWVRSGGSRDDYLDAAAWNYGATNFKTLEAQFREECVMCFDKGAAMQRDAQQKGKG